ncbi:MAG: hypothetical protein JJU13_09180 [Balneolaceae bacterium]|nr:hypothetical protein [Balneolaceae bacterium]
MENVIWIGRRLFQIFDPQNLTEWYEKLTGTEFASNLKNTHGCKKRVIRLTEIK